VMLRQKKCGVMSYDETFVKAQGSGDIVDIIGKQIAFLIPCHSLLDRSIDVYKVIFRIPYTAVRMIAGVSNEILGAACLYGDINGQFFYSIVKSLFFFFRKNGNLPAGSFPSAGIPQFCADLTIQVSFAQIFMISLYQTDIFCIIDKLKQTEVLCSLIKNIP